MINPKRSRNMTTNKPFDMSVNIILSALFPGYIFYAYYKIKKLRKFLIFFTVLVIIPLSLIAVLQQQQETGFQILTSEERIKEQIEQEKILTVIMISYILMVPVNITGSFFFLRRWAKQWNEQFESSMN